MLSIDSQVDRVKGESSREGSGRFVHGCFFWLFLFPPHAQGKQFALISEFTGDFRWGRIFCWNRRERTFQYRRRDIVVVYDKERPQLPPNNFAFPGRNTGSPKENESQQEMQEMKKIDANFICTAEKCRTASAEKKKDGSYPISGIKRREKHLWGWAKRSRWILEEDMCGTHGMGNGEPQNAISLFEGRWIDLSVWIASVSFKSLIDF